MSDKVAFEHAAEVVFVGVLAVAGAKSPSYFQVFNGTTKVVP
jgi:hypothetical protein